MIFYTLQGPFYKLEIHEDKLKLVRKNWLNFLNKKHSVQICDIQDLSGFQIVGPKFFLLSGKVQWDTFSGESCQFHFTTKKAMVKKIETYLQKRVIKNHQQHLKRSA